MSTHLTNHGLKSYHIMGTEKIMEKIMDKVANATLCMNLNVLSRTEQRSALIWSDQSISRGKQVI